MPNAKHKEKVKETSDVLKDCREVLHDGSNEIVAQMLAFMNSVIQHFQEPEGQQGPDCSQTPSKLSFQIPSN
jgi:hypothetical protein